MSKKNEVSKNEPLEFSVQGNTFEKEQFIAASAKVEQGTSEGKEGGDSKDAAKRERLSVLEREIKRGITLTRKNGASLKEIRDDLLYKSHVNKYKSFDAYCRDNIKLSRTHIYRLINHVEICEVLKLKYMNVPEKVVRPFYQLKKTVVSGEDRVDQYDANILTSIWNKACGIKAEDKKADKKHAGKLPSSTKVEALVKAYIAEAAGKKDDSMVYVVSLKTCFSREALVEGIIKAVTSAPKMFAVIRELQNILKTDEIMRMNDVCCDLIKKSVSAKEVNKAS